MIATYINKYKIITGPKDPNDPTKYLPVEVKTKNLMFEVPSLNSANEHGIDFLRPELAQELAAKIQQALPPDQQIELPSLVPNVVFPIAAPSNKTQFLVR